MNIVVSIIIPVYNVAPYVEQCLNSVLNQTYDNIEIIVVDDCGTDESMAIVEKIREKYSGNKILKIVHHEQNSGLSAARNTGIVESKGDWLYFLDSDDYITADCIQILVDTAGQDKELEVVVADYFTEDGKRHGGPFILHAGIYTEKLLDLYLTKLYYVPVWNKLVRKDFLVGNKLYFEEGLIHEDALWSFCVACLMKKMAIVNAKTYFYLIRSSSLDHIPNKQLHWINYCRVYALQACFLKQRKLMNNISAYNFVVKNWHHYFYKIRLFGNIDVIRSVYQEMKIVKSWNTWDLIKMKVPITTILRSLHVFMPGKYGFVYYIKMLDRFGI